MARLASSRVRPLFSFSVSHDTPLPLPRTWYAPIHIVDESIIYVTSRHAIRARASSPSRHPLAKHASHRKSGGNAVRPITRAWTLQDTSLSVHYAHLCPPRAYTRSASKHSHRPYCTSTTAPTADSIASHPIVSHRTLLSQPTHMGSRLWTNFPPSPVNRSTVRVRPEPSLSIIISQIGFEGALRSQAASGVYVLSYLPLWRSFCGAGESGLLI